MIYLDKADQYYFRELYVMICIYWEIKFATINKVRV